jgi:conjugal transfer pilus assembly protein TraF
VADHPAFQDETGWQVTLQDIDQKPDLGPRFAIEVTPTTILIRRGSQQRMVIATGIEAYPTLVQTAYQAARLFR